MNSTYYLFDMDGTLFFTDELNNDIPLEVQNICLELSCSCEQLSAFENDSTIVEELGKNGVSCFSIG